MKTSGKPPATSRSHPELKVVINGGSEILECASVPVCFGVNDALATIQPTHVLILITKHRKNGPGQVSEHMLVPLARGSCYLTFHAPGKHSICFLALHCHDGTKALEKNLAKVLEQKRPGVYSNPFTIIEHNNADGHYLEFTNDTSFIEYYTQAWHTTTLELPQELFAKRPPQWLWDYINAWHPYSPDDQCSFRRRALIAFTLKPIPWLLVRVILRYAIAFIGSVFILGIRSIICILGWRTVPLFEDFDTLWGWNGRLRDVNMNIKRYPGRYGLWLWGDDNPKKPGQDVYYPFTGAALLAMTIPPWAIWAFWSNNAPSSFSEWVCMAIGLVFIIILSLVAVSLFIFRLKFIERWTDACITESRARKEAEKHRRSLDEAQKKARPANKQFLYFEWLKTTLRSDKLPAKADPETMPEAFRRPLVHKLRLSYAAKKARVCKPFARE